MFYTDNGYYVHASILRNYIKYSKKFLKDTHYSLITSTVMK